MKSFLIRHHRLFMALFVASTALTLAFALSGCAAPTWLSDAGNILAMVGASVTSLGSFIATLTGNVALAAALAEVSTWITKIQTGISDLETLVSQYDESKDPTVLTNIEAGLADVQANLKQDFSNLGLPASVLSVIAEVAGLALTQITAWGSLIPGFKAAAGDTFAVIVPKTKAEYKAAHNAIVTKPTGDTTIDAALAKTKKL